MRQGLMDRLIYLLLITLQLSLLSQADHAPCYSPNGTSYTDKSKLCNSLDGTVTMCCGQTDTCLNNGLCRVAGYSIWWRDMCSVSSWPSVGCLKVCEEGTESRTGNSQMTPCDGTDYSEKWCCGSTKDCCGTGKEVIVPTNIYTSPVTSSTTSSSSTTSATNVSTTSGPSTTSASTPSPSSESKSESSSGLSTGAKVGVGVGVSVGALTILGALVFFIRRRRARKIQTVPLGGGTPKFHEKPAGDNYARDDYATHELCGESSAHTSERS